MRILLKSLEIDSERTTTYMTIFNHIRNVYDKRCFHLKRYVRYA